MNQQEYEQWTRVVKDPAWLDFENYLKTMKNGTVEGLTFASDEKEMFRDQGTLRILNDLLSLRQRILDTERSHND